MLYILYFRLVKVEGPHANTYAFMYGSRKERGGWGIGGEGRHQVWSLFLSGFRLEP